MKKYGQTFLTKTRITTNNYRWVSKSQFQFRPAKSPSNDWELSILGMINLNFLPWRLYVEIDDDTWEITKIRIGKDELSNSF